MLHRFFLLVLLLPVLSYAQESKLENVTLQLQWKYQFQFAGFIVAKEKGYYKELGLDVDILEYQNKSTIEDLENKKTDYAINNSHLAYDNKKLNNVTLLATYFQRSPLIIITQPEIKSVLDLKGKSVMVTKNNRYNSSISILFDYFDINENNTQFINPTFNIEDFINRKVDAVVAFRSNEVYELDMREIPYNVIDPVEHGFPTNAINLFTTYDKVKNNPNQVKKFLKASKRGWKYALENIDEVAELIHEKYQPNKALEYLKYEGIITKELMLLDLYEIGEVNEDFVLTTYKQLLKQGKLDRDQKEDKLFFKDKIHENTIKLSFNEKEWLKENSVVSFAGDPNWLPYEAFDSKKQYIGIVAEYLKLIEKNTGIDFNPIPTKSWSESIDIATKGKVKVISSDAADVILNTKFNAIDVYSKNPIVIIMDIKNHYVENLKSIAGKKIAIIKDYGYTADIFSEYPYIDFIEVENIQEGLIGVSDGKYDAMLATLALASYTMADMGIHNIKVVGKTPIIMDLTLFISKEEPILFSIINKAMQNITQEQKANILQKWIKNKYVERIDYSLAITIALFSIIIIVLVVLWSIKLKQEIAKKVDAQLQLKSSNEKLSGLYELSPLGIALTDVDGKYIEFNEAFKNICGYTQEELKTLNYWELTPKKYMEDEKRQLVQLKETGFYGPYEKEYIHKDGRAVAINLNGMIVTNPDGTKYIWSIVEDISERVEYQKNLEHNAHYDLLTDLPNRVLFADRLSQSMLHSERNGHKAIILYLDLDGFKEINDTYGHDIGDKLLIKVSKSMKCILRSGDSIARIGGDEFVILLNDFKEVDASIELINRILEEILKPILVEDISLGVSASIGVSFYPQLESISADQLLRQSDQAMYQAKLSGRNRYHIFNPEEDQTIRGHHEILERIKVALENDEFVMHYQPKVNLRSGEVIGVEALIRWVHPVRGILAPGLFLPYIEGNYLDVRLGEWVIDTVISQEDKWIKEGINLPVSINISATHIQQSDFLESFKSILARYSSVQTSSIELEILETTSIENMLHVSEVLCSLNKMGVQLSLDDFGTGYSSLTYLKRLPVQTLKIDQSFVRAMLEDPEDLAIINGVISLASAFNRNIIAEGMEYLEQGEILLRLGCDFAQGYAIARPMPVEEITLWIDDWKSEPSWVDMKVMSHEKLPILYAGAEHRAWVRDIENMIDGKYIDTLQLEKGECRFGKWLNSFLANNDLSEAMQNIVLVHQRVHDTANELIQLHNSGEKEQVKERLEDLYKLRDRLLIDLSTLF
ncbi:MAG: diguanylate cyclase (GGDEF)-like protein/PAS domain S-box-containing protein [Sulfurimonas sp.]|jgi:diguanylate cyclase (GGDEF)-like protein/PAS domain S-box-containing protein|uniref:EAL domain-containing protein n=1 Tax=Sulfurimonas sp. TaxID=2022749 RepID=UPI0039E2C58C